MCAPPGSLLPTPPRDFSGFAQPYVLPFQPGRQCGGCLADLPLAEAQVQACSWPHSPPPQSWADRKIPDIVVHRWLQAGRQQEVGAREGGPEPPEHLEASGLDRPCSTCLHECMWVEAFRALVPCPVGTGQGSFSGRASEGCKGSRPAGLFVSVLGDLGRLTVWVTPILGQK